jgi:large subunit ribosomal protein L18
MIAAREEARKTKVRAKKRSVTQKPRLSVYRSNKYIYAQVIDDISQKTIVAVSEKELKTKTKMTKIDKSKEIGLLIAKKAAAKKVNEIVFDRGSYRYHGRVKAVAEGAREGGLKF